MKALILLLLPFMAAAQDSPCDKCWPNVDTGRVAKIDTVPCIMLISDVTKKGISPVGTMPGYVIYDRGKYVRYTNDLFHPVPKKYYIWDIKMQPK